MPITCNGKGIGRLLGILWLAVYPVLADETVPPGPFTETECITCHTQRNPELIRQWREGPHSTASGVGCNSCHGDRHEDSVIEARKNRRCTGCHDGPASHSYATSKHGVINHLDKIRQDWRQPLRRGSDYRAPGCSYCHLHESDHG
ncbi:MAG: hypothetical protein KJO08_00175, partial [Gammaproteobacteria bacterium]|nr:hypothetical protein [Gammaproteobacteria bacterium]